MILNLATKIFGSSNERALKPLYRKVDEINALEEEYEKLSDDALRAKTDEFRKRLDDGEKLDDLLIEAFATVREASKRTLKMRHFDVQLIGGMVMHNGMIAEMKTGEGKTLVATLAAYLNALEGKGAHIVTVNDYLASRDAEWMGAIYQFLGMSVSCILHEMDDEQRRAAYNCDITYGTNNEFGFDYLRDNMKFRMENMVQRGHNFAIVDEVDSILIDEARTPLIISGPAQDSSELYVAIDKLIPKLEEGDYEKDEKAKSVSLTDDGIERMEELMSQAGLLTEGTLYDMDNIALVHHANQALRAHKLFTRDVDYVIKDDKVVIIDEFTGRMMEGRRYSEGLHGALEAKERVTIQKENQTLASITFQNYFRLYDKLSGMTGTAMTEAAEFGEIYGLEVVAVPTNKPMIRMDHNDKIFRTLDEKHASVVQLINDCVDRKQPVLVGTTSIEKSEELARLLKKHKIKHEVLNAKQHEREAHIVAQAGRAGAVTIATNMAGRGTDIKLGGNLEMRILDEVREDLDEKERAARIAKITKEVEDEAELVKKAGGLYVISTERHESRRIDNQLRGRSGRQGDPGASQFFLSLQDDLMRIFGTDRMDPMLQRMGLKEGEAIVHPWISKAIERAQQKVEAQHFEIRKNLLRFDNVMNDQRKVIYEQRREIMATEDVSEIVAGMREEVVEDLIHRCIPPKAYAEQWDVETLKVECHRLLGLDLPVDEWAKEEGIADEEIRERIQKAVDKKMAAKAADIGQDAMRRVEKSVVLQLLDQLWKEHLHGLDHLRQGISLRAYAQKDPLNEYKGEAFAMFEMTLNRLREAVTMTLALVEVRTNALPADIGPKEPQEMHESRQDPTLAFSQGQSESASKTTREHPGTLIHQFDPKDPSTWEKTPRNAPCPCGSGKKYKHCHGAVS